MYSTCLFCHTSLGTNEAIEHFPVGRRLAFDPLKGRLWVVCCACERWSLSPIEERWEAIEDCERAFSNTKLRVSTDQVGLARVGEGTTLVRIGSPQRPELAAWRYGDQFGRRRRRHLALSVTAIAVFGGLVIAGPVMGLLSGSMVNLLTAGNAIANGRTVVRLNTGKRTLRLSQRHLRDVVLRTHELFGYELEIPSAVSWKTTITWRSDLRRLSPSTILRGGDALGALRILLPRINSSGGSAAKVNDAVNLLERASARDDAFAALAQDACDDTARPWRLASFLSTGNGSSDALSAVPAAARLAMEMSLHEEDERRALAGELAQLEHRWKEAEEIAAISDTLFAPESMLERLRGRG